MRDLVIIGAGPGGFDTAVFAKEHGLDVVLIERETVGGTCLNWGCIPTKALYHNALLLKQMKELDPFGIHVSEVNVDFDQIKSRKETIVATQIENIHLTLSKLQIPLLIGQATIVDHHTVEVNGEQIETKHIIIATGSSPKPLSFDGNDLPIVQTSKGLLELATFPKRMIVVGAGVIGCEMASIFTEFGCDVTLVEYQDSILPTLDKDISKRARNYYKRQGITIHTNASFQSLETEEDGYVATVSTKKKDLSIPTDLVLVATGRIPNFGQLPLDQLGITHDHTGIRVSETKQTSVPSIYAIGDVNGELMLAHKATYDGYKAVSSILNQPFDVRFDLIPSVVFSIPEIASVGVTEQELESTTYRVAKSRYAANAKAVCMNETEGFIKLIADHENKLIGCHIIGTHASDLIHEVTALINQTITIDQYKTIVHAHPTLSEIIGECIKEFH